jgi:nicotinamidase-related amidase
MPKNVLIIVDFQNCFISGGSLGAPNQEEFLKDSIKQTNEIIDLINKNNVIVFTRDFHPINHMSLPNIDNGKSERKSDYQTVFTDHCRNPNRTCVYKNNQLTGGNYSQTDFIKNKITVQSHIDNSNNQILKKLNYQNKNDYIIGTELSYLYYFTEIADIVRTLVTDGREKNQYTIGLTSNDKNQFQGEPNIIHNNWNKVQPYKKDINGKDFVQLTKGEYCEYESYSAFNYHLKLQNWNDNKEHDTTLKADQLQAQQKYSTGLFEFLLKNYNTDLNITVCGLVSNICVMNTVHQGIAMWEKYKGKKLNITVNFKLSLIGSRFLSVAPPFINNVDETTNYNKYLDHLNNDLSNVATTNNIKNCSYELIINENKTTPIKFNKNKNVLKGGDHNQNCVCTNCIDNHKLNCACQNCGYKHKYLKYKQKYLQIKLI